MKISLRKNAPQEEIVDYAYFLEYIKILGMVLFGISLTMPVIILIVMDVDIEISGGHSNLVKQLIWDKPILPYVAGFLILTIQWFKFVEVNHHMKTTNLKHILITFGFFFILSLYPFFEMNIEVTANQPHSRAIFSAAWGLLGLFQYWQLSYAHRSDLIDKNMSGKRIDAVKRQILAEPAVALACIGLSYTSFLVWIAGMVALLPVMNYIITRISINNEPT